jgi:thiamine pyrophosphokinase
MGGRKVLVVADGDVPGRGVLDAAWPGWADGLDPGSVIAADGGALKAERLGFTPSLVVGDGDSLPVEDARRLAAGGVEISTASPDKDESDTQLAVLAACAAGAARIVVLGALGGRRFDHAFANVGLLAHEALRSVEATLLDGTTRVSLLRAPDRGGAPATARLAGVVGDLVSLLPFGEGVEGVETHGLRYPLTDEPLPAGPARGLSNVRTAPEARVSLRRGVIVIVETHVLEGADR